MCSYRSKFRQSEIVFFNTIPQNQKVRATSSSAVSRKDGVSGLDISCALQRLDWASKQKHSRKDFIFKQLCIRL